MAFQKLTMFHDHHWLMFFSEFTQLKLYKLTYTHDSELSHMLFDFLFGAAARAVVCELAARHKSFTSSCL
jgi:hypothetical protein